MTGVIAKHGTRIALAAILLLGAVLRLWHLGQDGFGTEYYAAGVRSMGLSWHNFFYNSFDPAGFVSLDKPPLAFWLQVLSTKLLGFSGFALLLPQVLEGLAAIGLLHHLVVRRFGSAAGLAGALCLALMPVSVAVDRSGNTDSALVLLLLLSAYALLRAIETARLRWLLLCAICFGLGFNAKMLAAFIPLPAFALLYLLAVPAGWARRIRHGIAAALLLIGVSLSWAAAFDLTPAPLRPYAGSSAHNSMLELVAVHNGLERFQPREQRPALDPLATPPSFHDAVPVGPLRLADRHLAAQVLWLLPVALAGLLLAWRRRETQADLLLWAGWLFSGLVVFSFAGGIFHAYYLVLLAPPLAALAGIGAVSLWQAGRRRLLIVLLLAAAWQAHIAFGAVEAFDPAALPPWLMLLPLLALPMALVPQGWMKAAALALLLVNPLVWSTAVAFARGYAMLPAADLGLLTRGADSEPQRRWRRLAAAHVLPSADPRLHEFLRANRSGERFALMTPSTRLAAPPILLADLPAMAFGGFSGRDPILTLDELARHVQDGELRFVLLTRGMPTGVAMPPLPEDDQRRRFALWVRDHGRPVPPSYWRSVSGEERSGLYDLRPETAPWKTP